MEITIIVRSKLAIAVTMLECALSALPGPGGEADVETRDRALGHIHRAIDHAESAIELLGGAIGQAAR